VKKSLVAIFLATVLAVNCFAVNKKIVMDGSTTVLPIAQAAAEVFMDANKDIEISVRGGGSGVGATSLVEGTCDIANMSRSMKDSEIQKAAGRGVIAKANVVAMDGIAVIVNPSNTVSALTKKQVKDIYTGKISNWKQIGGQDVKIVVISRDSASGTYEAFGSLALDAQKVRSDALTMASNQQIAVTVSNTPGAVGYVGLGFISEKVKALSIDGVIPSKKSVLTKEYVYSRPLFMYTNGSPKGDVKKLIDFIKSPEGQKLVDEQGFVALK